MQFQVKGCVILGKGKIRKKWNLKPKHKIGLNKIRGNHFK